jgi:hypothetical protein
MKLQFHGHVTLARSELDKAKWIPYSKNSLGLNSMVNVQEMDIKVKVFSIDQNYLFLRNILRQISPQPLSELVP